MLTAARSGKTNTHKGIAIMTQTYSLQWAPLDHRCRAWSKIIRADVELPHPSDVTGAGSIPGAYHGRAYDDELFPATR